jgi:hypothetical protein
MRVQDFRGGLFAMPLTNHPLAMSTVVHDDSSISTKE